MPDAASGVTQDPHDAIGPVQGIAGGRGRRPRRLPSVALLVTDVPSPAVSALIESMHKLLWNTAMILDHPQLRAHRDHLHDTGGSDHPTLQRLRAIAESALTAGPFSVCDKPADLVASSGDPHDYVSFGPYWWPDPDKPDGLPWIRHDGEVNPQTTAHSDRLRLASMMNTVRHLALAWFYLRDPRCAEHAVALLRAWFIDPDTRMNPHLRFAQAIPGRCEGRGIGLIDTAQLPMMLEAIELLTDAPAGSDAHRDELAQWVEALLDWMLASSHGQAERVHPNNHGTFYDVQVVRYAMFTGRTVVAREVLEQVGERRIADHIEPDGRQPRELARTKALGYSLSNLHGLCLLARLGKAYGLDLWLEEGPGGGSIPRAIAFLEPYITGRHAWPWPQIDEVNWQAAAKLLRLAAADCAEPHYARLAEDVPLDETSRIECELMLPIHAADRREANAASSPRDRLNSHAD